ncbi:pX [Bottlenose dolphin adenovirus 1]|uniref:PX n=1 Tax=Bottlenose dolphin adenovirus 1 TaxID=1714377 RepID=A0A1X7MMX5_9ADEN|nr:pX [Bottlenose dolphin adenovirus 1]SMG83447.1 pX [Bottlenose dolphin adenovirus 1]
MALMNSFNRNMAARRLVTCRVRVPISMCRKLRGRCRKRSRKNMRRRALRGGFLPALIPLIAAAIGAVPGIASVAVQAAQNRRN